MGLWRLGATPIVLFALLLGCIEDPPPSSYIEVTEIFTIRASVVELGPIGPERLELLRRSLAPGMVDGCIGSRCCGRVSKSDRSVATTRRVIARVVRSTPQPR